MLPLIFMGVEMILFENSVLKMYLSHETHYYGLFARDVSDMGYQPGVKLWLVYFRSLQICKNYHINAKYIMDDSIILRVHII
jgi:hypothetical protein